MERSSKYYKANPESAKKKDAYNRAYYKKNKKKANKSRAERAKYRRAAEKKGIDVKGKDVAHTPNGLRLKSVKANRGSTGDTRGDVRSRGGKGKKK